MSAQGLYRGAVVAGTLGVLLAVTGIWFTSGMAYAALMIVSGFLYLCAGALFVAYTIVVIDELLAEFDITAQSRLKIR
jgi:hypothetical protein